MPGKGRILVLCEGPVSEPKSGSETVAHHQAAGLARAGWEVCALTRRPGRQGPPVVQETAGFVEVSVPAPPTRPGAFFRALARELPRACDRLVKDGFSAVVAHQPLSYLLLRAAGRLSGVPLMYVFHAPWHQEYLVSRPWLPALAPGALARRRLESTALARAKRVVALSAYTAGKAHRIHGLPRQWAEVIPGGADCGRFSPPQKTDAPDGARVRLFTLRNLEPRMGLEALLYAMARLEADQPGRFSLLLGGSGPEQQRLAALRKKLSLERAVDLAGFIPGKDLPGHYQRAHFFVLPSADLEGFGLVTAESLACGTPVLGTPVGATPEILSGLDPGLVFADPSPEAMAQGIRAMADRAAADPGGYHALRAACRALARKKYTWERHVAAFSRVVEEEALGG
ncbi:MAG: glycosyltransferase family 4 protein [Deltaproteobacteria bacterium]|nr:glycosyltransferase family 4 protein [Deltaproteobacteria bacterium]